MPLFLGRRLFPKADPWERRRKLDILYFTIGGGVLVIAGVVLLIMALSSNSGGFGIFGPDGRPQGNAAGPGK